MDTRQWPGWLFCPPLDNVPKRPTVGDVPIAGDGSVVPLRYHRLSICLQSRFLSRSSDVPSSFADVTCKANSKRKRYSDELGTQPVLQGLGKHASHMPEMRCFSES